jgi:hypothetical protein
VESTRRQETLSQATVRASNRAFFVAGDLEIYRSIHSLSEEELAQWLGCPCGCLAKLALCRRPDRTAGSFRPDVERIAAYTGADRVRLAQLFREVDVLAVLQGAEQDALADRGFLLAARDRVEGQAVDGDSPVDRDSGYVEDSKDVD